MELTRRNWLKVLGGIALIPISYVGVKYIINSKVNDENSITFEFDNNFREGVSFTDDFIIVNKNSELTFFSIRCPHLGCVINRMQGEQLLCPCHGSLFNLDGTVTKGPSVDDLIKIKHRIDKEKNKVIVKIDRT